MQVIVYDQEPYVEVILKNEQNPFSAINLDAGIINSDILIIAKAGEPIQEYKAVAIINGRVYYADCTKKIQIQKPIGIALNNAQINEDVRILLHGKLTIPNFFVQEQWLFVGENGLIVQTPPNNAKYIKKLGVAITKDEALINQFEPIIIVE